MPFVDAEGKPLLTIELGQVPVRSRYFQLRSAIGYRESDDQPVSWAPAHEPSADPGPADRTDLASVPWLFWNLIASYGRQSAAAIVHDARSVATDRLDHATALEQRFDDDRRFRIGLRENGVGLFRAWLMWTVVSFQRYLVHAPGRFAGMITVTVLGAGLVVFAAVQALLAPIALLQLCAAAPWFLIENVVWLVGDAGRSRGSGPVLGPFATMPPAGQVKSAPARR